MPGHRTYSRWTVTWLPINTRAAGELQWTVAGNGGRRSCQSVWRIKVRKLASYCKIGSGRLALTLGIPQVSSCAVDA